MADDDTIVAIQDKLEVVKSTMKESIEQLLVNTGKMNFFSIYDIICLIRILLLYLVYPHMQNNWRKLKIQQFN